jgi:hyaluronan synthase
MASFFLQLNEFLRYGYVKAFLIFFAYTWVIWFTKLIFSLKYKPIINQYRPSYQVIVPVFKEDPVVFEQCLSSIINRKPSKLIVAVDGGDNQITQIAKKYTDDVLILEKVGKRKAMLAASSLLDDSLITIIVDSDTIWTSTTLEILNPFENTKVGGVTGRHLIFNENASITRMCADWLEQIRFDLVVPAQSVFGNVFCLPGRTMAFRTSIFKNIIPKVANKIIMGLDIIIGDDRDLTSETLNLGYKTVYQSNSVVLTDCPNTLVSLSAQQLRWYRSVTRETFRQFFLYAKNAPIPLIWALDFILSPAFLTGIIASELFKKYFGVYEYIPLAFVFDSGATSLWVSMIIVAGFFITYYIRQLPHLLKRPNFVWYLPLFIFAMWAFIFPIKLLALFTFLEQGWNTRKSAFSLNNINIIKSRAISIILGSLVFLPLFLFGFFNDLNLTGLSFEQMTSTPFTKFYNISFWQDTIIFSLQNLILISFIIILGAVFILGFSHRHDYHYLRQLQLKVVSVSIFIVALLGACLTTLSVTPIEINARGSVAGVREVRESNILNYQGQYVNYTDGKYKIKQLTLPAKLIIPEILDIYSILEEPMSEREKINLNGYLRSIMSQARRDNVKELIITHEQLKKGVSKV